jgi:prevent-host-death family protein
MRHASVSQLKATLSAYLAGVKAGEEVVITERGKPIAKLVPLRPHTVSLPPQLAGLERAGLLTVGSGKLSEDFWELPRPKDIHGAGLHALVEERNTGR